MTNIQTIKPKYEAGKKIISGRSSNAKRQSFKQVPAKTLTKQQEYVVDQALTNHYLGAKGKFLNFLSKTAGEVQNIWVMNIGTAFVAPLFIAHNPLSHDDENTKQYAAWRQPISAVIALAFGLGINIPVPNYIEKKVAEGKLEKFDLRAKPPEAYLKARYDRIQKHFNNLKGADKQFFDMVNDGKITNAETFKSKFPTAQMFTEQVHKVTTQKVANEMLDIKNPQGLKNVTLRDFLVKNLKFEHDYVNKSHLNPDATDSQLSKVKAMEFLRSFGYDAEEVNEKSLRAFINNNLYKADVKFDAKERKFITRVGETLISEEEKNAEKITMKHLFKVLKIDDNFGSNQKLLDMKMDKFIMWMNENMNIEESVQSARCSKPRKTAKAPVNNAELLSKRAKNIVKALAEKASKNYGGYKKIQGIALSLATLPFSCGLLNWAYPRIMDKYFPQLSKKPEDSVNNKGGK